MEEFIEIVVDGQIMQVQPNIPLLQALKNNDIVIPSLCYHAKLEPYGGCGLCLVESCQHGVWQVKHACLSMTEAGGQFRTRTERVLKLRGRAACLLLKRGPFLKPGVNNFLLSLVNQDKAEFLAESVQPMNGEFKNKSANVMNPGCILCGLCVRMCRKIGKNQLVFIGRGKNLRVAMAENDLETCGRCTACRQVCPTGFIQHSLKLTTLYG